MDFGVILLFSNKKPRLAQRIRKSYLYVLYASSLLYLLVSTVHFCKDSVEPVESQYWSSSLFCSPGRRICVQTYSEWGPKIQNWFISCRPCTRKLGEYGNMPFVSPDFDLPPTMRVVFVRKWDMINIATIRAYLSLFEIVCDSFIPILARSFPPCAALLLPNNAIHSTNMIFPSLIV